jgi:hypothetical protein
MRSTYARHVLVGAVPPEQPVLGPGRVQPPPIAPPLALDKVANHVGRLGVGRGLVAAAAATKCVVRVVLGRGCGVGRNADARGRRGFLVALSHSHGGFEPPLLAAAAASAVAKGQFILSSLRSIFGVRTVLQAKQ